MNIAYKIGLLILCIFVVVGCKKDNSTHVSGDPNNKQNEITNIAEQTGLLLLSDVIVFQSSDGGGRDSSYGFYSWVIFSPTPITMPTMKETSGKDHFVLPLESTVSFFEHRIGKKIFDPQVALSSLWDNAEYSYRGTLVRSPKGDYLYIERFRKK